MIVYLSGPMAGVEDYPITFGYYARELKERHPDWAILNPAAGIDPDTPDRAAFNIDMAMLGQADAICLLPGWEGSRGCNVERDYAMRLGLEIINIKWLPGEEDKA